jgi:hypothetical protein
VERCQARKHGHKVDAALGARQNAHQAYLAAP